MKKFKSIYGFTLIELLTVIAVIGVLAAILIPAIGKVRESTNRTVCASNLRQLSAAMSLFSNDYPNQIGAVVFPSNDPNDPPAEYWFRQIYPYLKDDTLEKTTELFQCPSDESALTAFEEGGTEWSTISYLFIKRDANWTRRLNIENPGNEPQFVEAHTVATNNYRSAEKFENLLELRHGTGINVAYWDGSVAFIDEPTYETVFRISTGE